MKKESKKEKSGNEPVVIADECGDSMWDAVLQQEAQACEVTDISNYAATLPKRIDRAEVTDTTKAKQLY
jgi:hypothetical protein